MTKPNDWENADWDQAAQETFWKNYRRSRNRKLEMLNAKARLLFGSGEEAKKQVARDLLEDVLTAYQENRDGVRDKQKFPKSYKDGVLNCVGNLANLCDADGCIDGAERALESFWSVYFDDYAPAISRSDFLLRLPGLLMDVGRFDEARERLNTFQQKMLIDDSNCSPYLQFRFAHAWARYGDLTGEYSRCDETFLEFQHRTHGEAFRSYVDLEQMPVFDVHGDVETDPRSASESIITYHHADIPTVFEKSRQSLVDLDLHLGLNAPSREYQIEMYKIEFLNTNLVPLLGAYFGEVLCAQAGGEWQAAQPLMGSRIKLTDRAVNPFEIAYMVTFFGRSLAREFNRIVLPDASES